MSSDAAGNWILWSAGLAAFITVALSSFLISQHFQHYNMPEVQKKIIGILYMAPIYAVDSLLSIAYPPAAVYINMLHEDDYEVIVYLETKLPYTSHKQYSKGSLSKGKAFLRYCKFGVLQYCVIRPMTAVFAMLFSTVDFYDESDISLTNSNIYLLFLINCSVLYAFTTLGTFYYALKDKLAPFEPVGKFLVIKFVIFFAFWQSVIITGLVYFNIIDKLGSYGHKEVAVVLQDYLICLEMVIVSVANHFVFSWKPFTEQAILQDTLNILHQNRVDTEAEMEITLYEGHGQGYIPPSKKAVVSSGVGGTKSSVQKTSQLINKSSARLSLAVHKGLRSKSGYRSVSTSSQDVELALNQVDGEDETLLPDRLVVHGEDAQNDIADLEDPYTHEVQRGSKKPPQPPPPPPPRINKETPPPAAAVEPAAAPTTVKDKAKLIAQKLGWGTSSLAHSGGIHEIMDRHFATSSAIRDFNESMPVVVLPTTFRAQKGVVIQSNPAERMAQAQQQQQQQGQQQRSASNSSKR